MKTTIATTVLILCVACAGRVRARSPIVVERDHPRTVVVEREDGPREVIVEHPVHRDHEVVIEKR